MSEENKTLFVPQLYISSGTSNIEFYAKAFGAIELRRWMNDDGTYHVAELSIDGAMFHLHEEKPKASQFSPEKINGTTALIGLFVKDVDAVMTNAVAAGATVISPAQSYEYGYRQGELKDPFGHHWMIEMKI
jgi:PhnB protein